MAEPTRVPVRRPRFRRAVATGCGAALALIVGPSVVPRHAHTIDGRALLDIPAVVFLVLVIACARSSAVELDALARWRGGQTAGSALRMLVTGFGYGHHIDRHTFDAVDLRRQSRPGPIGALGGEFYGTVTSMSLTDVSILTDEGMLKVPNSSLLAAAVWPWDHTAHHRSEPIGANPRWSALAVEPACTADLVRFRSSPPACGES